MTMRRPAARLPCVPRASRRPAAASPPLPRGTPQGWHQQLEPLRRWLQGHADGFPSRTAASQYERRLAVWVHNRRREYAQGRLDSAAARAIEALPRWSWTAWREQLDPLRQWLQEHPGAFPLQNADTPTERRLARWVNHRRHEYSQGTLGAEAVAAMEALPRWSWRERLAPRPAPRENLPAPKRQRLRGKQPPPPLPHGRGRCDYPGCQTADNTRVRVGDRSYCMRHARLMQREQGKPVACVSLEEWKDNIVVPHSLGVMAFRCELCKSMNFEGEYVGAGGTQHFNI